MRNPTPQQISKWLEETGRSRSELATELNVSSDTVKGWLSSNRPITGAALQLLHLLMKPSIVINPQFTLEEWLRIESLAKAEGLNARDWINLVLKREIGTADQKPQPQSVKSGPVKPADLPCNIMPLLPQHIAADVAGNDDDLPAPQQTVYSSGLKKKKG